MCIRDRLLTIKVSICDLPNGEVLLTPLTPLCYSNTTRAIANDYTGRFYALIVLVLLKPYYLFDKNAFKKWDKQADVQMFCTQIRN